MLSRIGPGVASAGTTTWITPSVHDSAIAPAGEEPWKTTRPAAPKRSPRIVSSSPGQALGLSNDRIT